MGYVLGISSGLWRAGGQKEEFFGIVRKGYQALTYGVTFTQIDIDTVTEFKDPFLRKGIEELKRFGISFGFHGETLATTSREVIMLDSAIKDIYDMTHQRLIEHLKNAGELGAKYVLFHASENTPFQMLFREFQPSKLVDFWGRPIKELIESEKFLEKFVFESEEKIKEFLWGFERSYHISQLDRKKEEKKILEKTILEFKQQLEKEKNENEKTNLKMEIKKLELQKEAIEKAIEYYKNECLKVIDSYDLHYGPERFAYYVVAKYLNEKKDPIWMGIVGRQLSDEEIIKHPELWVGAVATKYIWGHFNPRIHEDPKPILEKYKMYIVFETQMAAQGQEGMMRIAHPKELYYLAKNLGTPYAAWALDIEHVLSCGIDPEEAIKNLPEDAGKYLKVVHITYPSPLNPSHYPIPLGSEAQEYVYKLLYILRQKGFKDGWIIYERGSAPIQQTIIVLRKIKEFLEKDTPPEELPPEFYGFKIDEPEVIRQRQIILQHALDPIKGLVSIPEEDHTFLSRIALEKGRLEQWKKGEMR
ncbi:MAG TPA: hypothetical protein EYH56_00785 [Nanoarchaeota archaeon]|nr:hypothetical protein [Nanoarchaeota archaeon]